MARTSQVVQVGKRTVELSNLKKVLYPDDQIVKAELIRYYLGIAPTILAHVKNRPLSLVRYPDGIDGEQFFQKNRPDWAPEWIEYVTLGSEERLKDYILATEQASMVWLANLACIELHQMHAYKPHFDKPDYFVFDLDPPEDFPFSSVIKLAFKLRLHLQSFGYNVFVKTTGRKGLHLVVPIEPKWSFDKVFETAQLLAKPFVEANGKETTLNISKERRVGKVLIDIYRNHQSQTIVSAYSARGLPGAPVSMPLTWDELPDVKASSEFTILNVLDKVITEGDPWEGIGAFATALHTERKAPKSKKTLKPSPHRKAPDALEKYAKKRSFEKTPEPKPLEIGGEGSAFVVHRHAASRLHYDLRLEKDGVLKSWAVPKGLPPRPGIMRLAVATEDHPLEYLTFDGSIPKGEYGGGRMWVYAQGRYEVTKEKKKGFYFRLQSKAVSAEYRIHSTKENQWLLERVDLPQIDWLTDPIGPMLASSEKTVPESDDYFYEVKWDGIRAMIAVDEGNVTIRSRNLRDITDQFPELHVPDQAFRATSALFDCEIVCLDGDGKPDFKQVINRLHHNNESTIERAKAKHPAVCYAFDCLYLDGRPLVHEPLWQRREWMIDSIRRDTPYRISEAVDEGAALFEAAKNMGLEGIMAKDKNSAYYHGRRTGSWIKIKTRQTTECLIIGYTEGNGDRAEYFGALHLATPNGKGLKYVGKVGTGFDTRSLKSIFAELEKVPRGKRPVKEKPLDDAQSVWLEPKLLCEIQFASMTSKGTLREPVFLRLRPDIGPETP